MAGPDLPVLAFADAAAFRTWLEANADASPGFWMKFAKAGAPEPTLTKAEAIATALCFGWIDGQIATLDAHHFRTRFTPRRAKSKWSAINRRAAEDLISQGLMAARGMQEVEAATADGRWEAAYPPQSEAIAPSDLKAALAANPAAERFFGQIDAANRYAVIYRVNEARKPQTRADRIARFVDMLARGETIHPPRRTLKPVGS